MYYDEGFYSRSFLLSSSFWIMLPKAQNLSHPAMNHFKETSNREAWILNYIIISCFHTSSFELCCQRQKTYHFQQCIISGRALRPPTVPALTLIPGSIRPNMLVANIPFKFWSRYSLLKTFHFNILLFLLSQRHTFKMKNSWWGRIPPLFNKWDLFLGILSPLSSFQTLITQFWNCRDRKVSLIPGFHRSKSNPHNRDTKLM